MNKKNLPYIIFTAAIILLALIPLVSMPFYKNKAEGAEQREKSPFPKLIVDGKINESFGSEFEDYFQDRFAFRSELVNAGSTVMVEVFNSSPEDSVICGKDDWLFFAETLEDYSGTDVLTDAELGRIATVIRLEKEFCERNGAAYVFAAAPNKNSVYSEYMQEHYVKTSEDTNLERLNVLLKEEGVSVANLKSALINAKNEGVCGGELYYYADSHWNLAGATVAYNAIMEALASQDGLLGEDFSYDDYADAVYGEAIREGDLLKMVLPLDCNVNEVAATSDIPTLYKHIGRYKGVDDMTIKTQLKDKGDEGEETGLLMFRDSFGRSLMPLFSNQFTNATYLRATPFDIYNNIDGKNAVVREIVERNLDLLLDRAPVVAAYEADLSAGELANLTAFSSTTVINEEKGDLTKVYGFGEAICGEGEASATDYNYRVFALVDGKYYEGFPIYEDTLEETYGECGSGSFGFSFYFEGNADNAEFFYTTERSGAK